MSDISNNNNDVLGYVITYTLSTEIQCLGLPTSSDVEFIKSNGSSYVSGLKITVSKSNMSDALEHSRIIAEKITYPKDYQYIRNALVNSLKAETDSYNHSITKVYLFSESVRAGTRKFCNA